MEPLNVKRSIFQNLKALNFSLLSQFHFAAFVEHRKHSHLLKHPINKSTCFIPYYI